IYRHSDLPVVYGDHVKRYLIGKDVSTEQIFVVSHAVDNEVYNCQVPEIENAALRNALNLDPDQKVVLYLGRLEAVKGLLHFIEAFAALKRDNVVMIVASTGSE
ncbi:MAG: glycosyltransferase, partial [Armatimonadota bacterium]